MTTPADIARRHAAKQEQIERGIVYRSGSVEDTSIAAVLDVNTRQNLEALKHNLLDEAKITFGDEFDDAEVRETYAALEDMIDHLDIEGETGSTAHAVLFGETGNSTRTDELEPEAQDPDAPDYLPSRLADKYIVRAMYGPDTEVAAMVAGPVPYVHGNAIFVSRDPRCGAALNMVIGAAPGTVTRTEFCERTGAARVIHRGTPESVQERVTKLLSMDPTEFVAEVESRKQRALQRRLARRAETPIDQLVS
ncbi:MAG: hypothetical protein ABIP74_01875 [Candidatus Saccharimonas sp.]